MIIALKLAVIATIATLTLAGCGDQPGYPALPAGSVVLAIGDSVTHGTGAGRGEAYPNQLAAISGWQIENHGIPGDTSAGVLQRIDQAVQSTQPALVILEIGGNDFLRRVPESTTRDNIRSILRIIRQHNTPVVLVSTPAFSPFGAVIGMLPDAPLYRELAEEERVPLIPDIFARVLSDDDLKADPIHPNGAGYRQLAEGIAERLRELGFLGQE